MHKQSPASRGARALLTLAGAAVSAGLSAQTAPAPAAAAPAAPAAEEEIVVLSPFEVTTSRNIGYTARDTLAGSRIRTELKDVGSAITVVTSQFLTDTGATSNQDLLQYLPSTEVGGMKGNFGGLGDGRTLDDSASRLNPNGNTRVRGLEAADNTRGFFRTNIPWDSYNTSRIDVQRGPNAILFGIGSAAGIINSDVDGASLGKTAGTAEVRYGSYGSYRGSLNYNHVLLEDELAIRIGVLHNKDYFQQKPAYSRDNRIYGALRWDPKFMKMDGARTSVKFNYEKVDIQSNRPRTTTPVDGITPWFRTTSQDMVTPDGIYLGTLEPMKSHDGYNPFYTGISTAAIIAANAANFSVGAAAGPNLTGNGSGTARGTITNTHYEPWLYAGSGHGVNGKWYGGFGAIYADPNSSDLSYYQANSATAYLYGSRTNTGAVEAGTAAGISGLRGTDVRSIASFSNFAAGAVTSYAPNTPYFTGLKYNLQGVYRDTTLSDPAIFDFYNKLLDGPNKHESQKYEVFNGSIEQTFFHEKFGINLAFDRQTTETRRTEMLGGSPTITIDVNRYLPAATLVGGVLAPLENPNFGRAYVVGDGGYNTYSSNVGTTMRGTAFGDLNFKDILEVDNIFTKILGRHVITGLAEYNRSQDKNYEYSRYSMDEESVAALTGRTYTVGDVTRKIVTVNYLSDSLATASSPTGLTNISAEHIPTDGAALYFNGAWTGSASGASSYGSAWNGVNSPLSLTQDVAVASRFQSENPANYQGWTSQGSIGVLNAAEGDLAALTTRGTVRRLDVSSWALVDQWYLFNGKIVAMAGLRQDRIKTYDALNANNYPVNTTTGVINLEDPIAFNQVRWPYPKKTLKTYSVVGHTPDFINKVLPWGLNASAFYNQSENFKPQVRKDVYGDYLPTAKGDTKDYGIVINALDNRVSLKITKYKTNVYDADLNGDLGQIIWRMGDAVARSRQAAFVVEAAAAGATASSFGNYNYRNTADATDTTVYPYEPLTGTSSTWTTADWQTALSQANASAAAFRTWEAANAKFMSAWDIVARTPNGNTSGYAAPAGTAITGDTVSKGTEYELNLRPVDAWNITINASKTSAIRLNLASTVSGFMEEYWALMNGPAGMARWFGGGQGNGATSTGMARVGRNAWAYYSEKRAQEGNDVPELRPWRFNIVNTYNFSTGFLKGAFVGGSYRWQDRNTIGYGVTERTAFDPVQASNAPIGYLDPEKPFYGPTEDAVDLWIGYNRKIWGNIDWRIQLNVRSVFDEAHLVPISTNPDGSVAAYRIADGRSWQLTSTFKF